MAIGRNEGERLQVCLRSLLQQVADCPVVYVDSGSTDGSQAFAEGIGVHVVNLDTSVPFTAARARNQGMARLLEIEPNLRWIQFLDGDCDLLQNWLPTALDSLSLDRQLAVVCGRRRERYPNATYYNALIDQEWDTPKGKAKACGGDALFRAEALHAVGGFDETMIAGEEPELCYRLRQAGWQIERIDVEMTLHDANITSFSQWWKRAMRYGWTLAEGVWRYGHTMERYNVRPLARTLFWSVVLPVGIAILCLVLPHAWLMLLFYPLQAARVALREYRSGIPLRLACLGSGLTLACRWAELLGIMRFAVSRLRSRPQTLIEYK